MQGALSGYGRGREAGRGVYDQLHLPAHIEGELRDALESELAEEATFTTESLSLARRRLARAEHEREKLLQAYFADALPLDMFKREQKRVTTEIGLAQAEIQRLQVADSPYQELLEFALSLIRDARHGYASASPYLKRLWNQALLARIEVAGGRVVYVQLRPPFDAIFSWRGSNKGCLVGGTGLYLNS